MQSVLRPASFGLRLSSPQTCERAAPCASGSQRQSAQAFNNRAAQADSSFTWAEGPRNDRDLKERLTSLQSKLDAWREENMRLQEEADYWLSVMTKQLEDPEYVVPAAEVLTWGDIRPELKSCTAVKLAQSKLEESAAD